MKVPIALIVLVLIIGVLSVFLTRDSELPSDTVTTHFQDELTRAAVERVGQPVEGFNAFMLLDAIPTFIPQDFEEVETFEGVYRFKEGELGYVRTQGNPVTSAEDTISHEGYRSLLVNVSDRLGAEFESANNVDVLLKELLAEERAEVALISDDYSFWYPPNWYPHELGGPVMLTHDEELTVPAGTEGYALGPWIQVTVEELDDSRAAIESWFKRQGFDSSSPFVLTSNEVLRNGVQMTRIEAEAAGAGGSVLHYVVVPDPNRIILLSQYPYDEKSQDSKDFEYIVESFQPHFLAKEPDDVPQDEPKDEPVTGILPFESGVMGSVLLGPTCPVMREPPDPNCADKPYPTEIRVNAEGDMSGTAFSVVETDKEGSYRIMLPPGNYTLVPQGGRPFPSCSSKDITVLPDTMLEVDLQCDTGIR